MPINLKFSNKLKIRIAVSTDIHSIHEILSEAFKPYRKYYTKKAYKATVISPEEIEKRIENSETIVLVADYANVVIGTASINLGDKTNLYIQSMAVKPTYQGKGIGLCILTIIERIGKEKNCKIMSLESYEPLKKAVLLYEKFGFKRTGKERDYQGITVFEMIKELD